MRRSERAREQVNASQPASSLVSDRAAGGLPDRIGGRVSPSGERARLGRTGAARFGAPAPASASASASAALLIAPRSQCVQSCAHLSSEHKTPSRLQMRPVRPLRARSIRRDASSFLRTRRSPLARLCPPDGHERSRFGRKLIATTPTGGRAADVDLTLSSRLDIGSSSQLERSRAASQQSD